MTKETAVLRPSPWQAVRSARPYLAGTKPRLRGTVTAAATATGQRFVVYLPAGHDGPGREHGVLYHLHGAGMRWPWVAKDIEWLAAEHERAVERGVVEPMVIVGAYDPSRFSMWTDSADGTNDRATAVLSDLLPHVESTYPVRTDRASRHIQGFSMGGFGAASLGLDRQDLFASIVIWDGALHDWSTLTRGRPGIAADQFAGLEANFRRWSPWALAEQADLPRTPILVVAGLMEDFARRYTEHLVRLGASVTFASVDCLHDLRCLERAHGQQAFEFVAAAAGRPHEAQPSALQPGASSEWRHQRKDPS